MAYEYGELQTNGTVDATKNSGNIGKQTLTVPGTSFVTAYKYDPLNRLTEAQEKTGSTQNWIQTFGYDLYGNRTSFSQTIGSTTTSTTPTVNASTNRFNTGQGFTYDANGNVIQDVDAVSSHTRSFTFNGDNKQTQVKDVTNSNHVVGTYYYDGEGKRVKKVTDTETTVFVYALGKIIAEYSTQISSTPSVAYTTADHLGSPRVITNEQAQVESRRDFMPFGEELYTGVGGRSSSINYSSSADDVRQKFTAYQKDSETNLDFAEARMYENRFGRFTAVDPMLASGQSANPQSFNRYIYCLNNPLRLVDRNGKWPTETHKEIIRGAFSLMKERFLKAIEKGSYDTDNPGTVDERNAPQHAMTRGSDVEKYGLEKATEMAKKEARDFIESNLAMAKQLAGEAAKLKYGSEEWAAKMEASLTHFGAAAHTIMDNVSPAHAGFQVFKSYPDTAIDGAKGALSGGTPAMLGAAAGAVAADITTHYLTERPKPTDAQNDVMYDRLRYALCETYGNICGQAMSEEDKKATNTRTNRKSPGTGI